MRYGTRGGQSVRADTISGLEASAELEEWVAEVGVGREGDRQPGSGQGNQVTIDA